MTKEIIAALLPNWENIKEYLKAKNLDTNILDTYFEKFDEIIIWYENINFLSDKKIKILVYTQISMIDNLKKFLILKNFNEESITYILSLVFSQLKLILENLKQDKIIRWKFEKYRNEAIWMLNKKWWFSFVAKEF